MQKRKVTLLEIFLFSSEKLDIFCWPTNLSWVMGPAALFCMLQKQQLLASNPLLGEQNSWLS